MSRLGYTRLTAGDYAYTFGEEVRNNNICGYIEIEKVKFEEFKQHFIDRTFNHIRKMSQIRVNILGVYFWKDISKNIAENQIMRIKQNLNTDEDVVSYLNQITDQNMDVNRPLWEIRILENYTETTSIVMTRLHHSFTDGLGFVSLIS